MRSLVIVAAEAAVLSRRSSDTTIVTGLVPHDVLSSGGLATHEGSAIPLTRDLTPRSPRVTEQLRQALAADVRRGKRSVSAPAYAPRMPNQSLVPASEVLTTDRCAEVRARGSVIRYRRRGSGPLVLVLANGPTEPWPDLAEALSAEFRVITPEPAGDLPDTSCWLADFLDGLGASNVGVVAFGGLGSPAREHLRSRPDQVSRVAIVPAASSAAGEDERMRPAGDGGIPGIPLLIVSRDLPPGEAIALIAAFLGESPAAPA